MPGSLTDSLNLISKLSPKKVWNILLIWSSYQSSKFFKKNYHRGMPISVSIEPTTSCNLRCPECPSGLRSFTRPTGMLDINLFRKTIDELKNKLIYLTIYFQGEPFLHPHIFDLFKYASQRKIYTATSTNGHYMDKNNAQKIIDSGLDRLIISIDGTTQKTYEQYRIGGSLEKVIQGTKNVVAAKKKSKSRTPHIIFQFLVVKPNEHQIEEVKQLARDLEIDDVGFKTAQIYDYKKGSPLIPDSQKYSRYLLQDDGTYVLKNNMVNSCWRMWQSSVITWDGKMVPCCFDKDATHNMGNISNGFTSVWKSAGYDKFRSSLLTSRSEIEMCKNCTEGTKVWA